MKSVTTTQQQAWQKDVLKPSTISGDAADLPALTSTGSSFEVFGLGGTFNEMGYDCLLSLDDTARMEVMHELFSPDGCNFNFCRIPIGASDFGMKWYSHADAEDDYEMKQFSIDRDRELLLPYVKDALEVRPDCRFFASAWSPPAWLKEKNRYNGSRLRDEPRVYEALATYFSRFLEAYRKEGIEIAQLHVQNEPNSDQKFPSCLWTGASMRNFVRDHLGPAFAKAGESCEIWAGTIERGYCQKTLAGNSYHEWVHTIFSDAEARKYIAGVGYQWAGKGALAHTRANWPRLRMMQTENECGDGTNSWDHAFYVFDLMWQYFHHGCESFIYWNMVLPKDTESTWGWRQNSLFTVDTKTGEVIRNPEFYFFKHLTHFVKPGAKIHQLAGHQAALSLLFENPNGEKVLLHSNPLPFESHAPLAIDGFPEFLTFPAQSVSTVVI